MAPLFKISARVLAALDGGDRAAARERATACLSGLYYSNDADPAQVRNWYVGAGRPTRFRFHVYSFQQWRRAAGLALVCQFLEQPFLTIATTAMLAYMIGS